MIDLLEINEFELNEYIEIAYNGDEDLLTKYHVDTYKLGEAVEMTMAMIEITSMDVKMTNYGVLMNGEKIGYLSILERFLYSFGINIEKRTKEILSEFWESIKTVLGDSFVCMLYPNNSRAIGWLEKCGMEIVDGVEDNCVTLLYHKLN